MLVFFSVNKQAFCNYYYLVVGAFACGGAASFPLEAREQVAQPRERGHPEPARPADPPPAAVPPPNPRPQRRRRNRAPPESCCWNSRFALPAPPTPGPRAASWSPSGS